jgi:hypothetical protein
MRCTVRTDEIQNRSRITPGKIAIDAGFAHRFRGGLLKCTDPLKRGNMVSRNSRLVSFSAVIMFWVNSAFNLVRFCRRAWRALQLRQRRRAATKCTHSKQPPALSWIIRGPALIRKFDTTASPSGRESSNRPRCRLMGF